ncbi:Hint domain-containing protein, partial [Acinetobacter sp. ME22]|uniref:Hint domain-containing protein n=1 Tax=Acinetobacter sp. ME22 TaxID=2904802 RepID=UPI001EDB7AEE
MFNFGCFVAGTLVTTDKGKVPIQDIKVGDLVLSKPEDGIGEPEFKPVLKTFVHEQKPIWMVRARRSPNFFDSQGEMIDYQKYKLATRTIDFLATPNH